MRIGKSVKKSIDDWLVGDLEASMLHACNTVDGTARKCFPNLQKQNKLRFTKFLRENYDVLGPMGAPGIDLEKTRFPVAVQGPTASDGKPDISDVIYAIHRCYHSHGDELPDGFALVPDAAGPPEFTVMTVQNGSVQLSDRMIFAMLAVCVLSPVNIGEPIPEDYYLTFGAQHKFIIEQWWGRKPEFIEIIRRQALPQVKLDFGDWMTRT
jgi:hypothetical protein